VKLFVAEPDAQRARAVLARKGDDSDAAEELEADQPPDEEIAGEKEGGDEADMADPDADFPKLTAADALVNRAWRASAIGLFAGPPLFLHLYSLWLLAKVILSEDAVSDASNWKFLAAAGIDLFVFLLAGLFVFVVFLR
jgi:hypothetical protein